MRRIGILLVAQAVACAPAPIMDTPAPVLAPGAGSVGVLVMAHGGTPEWNASVEGAVNALREDVPTAVAYGMANPRTLSAALDSLGQAGVERVAVVRMFLSGESFLDQTEYFLGMRDTPPEMFVLMGPAATDPAARQQLAHELAIATHPDGMLVSPEAATIMTERAKELSHDPDQESVLLVAHGMGDERENDDVLAAVDRIAGEIRAHGFTRVRSATLREDWAAAREVAETEIRGFVAEESAAGRRVLVLPMRLSGFGPYAEVLDGLDYVPGKGLLPHAEVATWVRATANRVTCEAGWGAMGERCATVLTARGAESPSTEQH